MLKNELKNSRLNISSIKYLFGEGLHNVFKNWMMSVASVGVLVVCLLLTGAAALFSASISNSLKDIESRNSIKVNLNENIDAEKAKQIEEQILNIPNVISCKFHSKEQALEGYKKSLGEELFKTLEEQNPLPNSFFVTLEDLSKYADTQKAIVEIDGVNSVLDRSNIFDKLTALDRWVRIFGGIIVFVLALVSLFIISNTIRLTMYSRRFEISIMKSVGATNLFVRIPFLVEGALIGICSAVISSCLLKLLCNFIDGIIRKNIPFINLSLNEVSMPIVLIFLGAGILFGLIGGFISIGKYLKKEGGEILGW